MGFRVQRKASPRVTSHPPKVPHTLQIYTFFHHVVNSSPLLEAPWCFAGCLPGASLVLRRLSDSSFPASLVPHRPVQIDPFRSPWCLPGCPIDPFLPPWVLPRLSKWLFPTSLVPPWCLASYPMDPFLPPWCPPSCPMSPFLPPWCLSGCPNGPFLPPCQKQSCAPSGSLKASLCYGQPAVEPTPGFAANRADRH